MDDSKRAQIIREIEQVDIDPPKKISLVEETAAAPEIASPPSTPEVTIDTAMPQQHVLSPQNIQQPRSPVSDAIEQARRKIANTPAEAHSLYRQWLVTSGDQPALLRYYRCTDDALFASFSDNCDDAALKHYLSEVLWPIALSEQRDENGGFWCLMPAPSKAWTPLSAYIFPNEKKIAAKFTTDLCISFVTFLCKLQSNEAKKLLGWFDPDEIFIDEENGCIHFTGLDQIIDASLSKNVAQLVLDNNKKRTFIPERFMPPEFFERKYFPLTEDMSYYAALFSCLLLLRCHPYEGKQWAKEGYITSEEAASLYGKDRLFIFDPADPSNGPVPNVHTLAVYLWQMQPIGIQKLFEESFSSIKQDGRAPLDAFDWLRALIYLRSVTYFCSCGNIVINKNTRTQDSLQCNYCKATTALPLTIAWGSIVYRLSSRMLLYYGQFDADCDDPVAYSTPICRIREKKSTGELGIERLPGHSYTVLAENNSGECKILKASDPPFPIRRGYRIYVNNIEAEIK